MPDLIYDRTDADVALAARLLTKTWAEYTPAERAAWLAGLKGAYNATDLNRVGTAVRYLADVLRSHGYTAVTSPRMDWAVGDIPSAAETETYLADIRALIETFTVFPETPELPGTMERLTHDGANAIERILYDIDRLIRLMTESFIYGSEIQSGEF